MKPSRILFLLVALIAGGLAAYLATRGNAPVEPQVVTEVQKETRTNILVARSGIGVGERLNPEILEWQEWPSGAVRPEYVTRDAVPDAVDQLTGAVARFEFFPGEPIREAKLARADQGYMSAILAPGYRGVSIPVKATAGAGGFIVPNDRVDVVLTRNTNSGRLSETILHNVKVLAIGQRLGEMGKTGSTSEKAVDDPKSQNFVKETIATLELDPGQAETLINASEIGVINLVLRSVTDFTQTVQEVNANRQNASIRLIRYGRSSSVLSGTGGGDQPPPAGGEGYQPPAESRDGEDGGLVLSPPGDTNSNPDGGPNLPMLE